MSFKSVRRDLRLRLHRWRNGDLYRIHGCAVDFPVEIARRFANQIVRGSYERDEAEMAVRHLPKNLPVIELGGSLGVISAVLRSHLHANVPLLVVEGNPELLDICRANLARHDTMGTAQLVHAAIHHGGGTVRFNVRGNAHVGRVAGVSNGAGTCVEVPAVSLGDLLARLQEKGPVSLVSDIEGAEFDLFSSEPAALARVHSAIVEIHPPIYSEQGRSEEQFLDLAARSGFRIAERRANVLALTR